MVDYYILASVLLSDIADAPIKTQCMVTCVICWVCGMLGESERGQTGVGKAKTEREESDSSPDSKSSASPSFLAAFPKARYDRDVAMKVMPLSAIFVIMIVSNQLTLKYVEVSFYNVAR